jgi:hypothetical protein
MSDSKPKQALLFCKKRRKKLLLDAGIRSAVAAPHGNESFFASFFAEKKLSLSA